MVYRNLKPIEMVKRATKGALFTFEHGLGDLINFLPVYKEFCRQSGINVILGSSAKRQFHLIDSRIITISEFQDFRSRFDYHYRIHYPDSVDSSYPIEHHNEAPKPYLCAIHELGMVDFIWKPYRMPNKLFDPESKRVGVHLFGHTGMTDKFVPEEVVLKIWKEIEDAGYEPFEVHMRPGFSEEYKCTDRGSDDFCLATQDNSLRFEKPDLKRMIEETSKCRFFIGIDSGPIYLAGALIGHDRLIGLINGKRHDHFMPVHISTVGVKSYKEGSIHRILNQKGEWL